METLDKLRDIFCEQLDIEREEVVAEALVFEDLGADSLDIVDLVMALEEAFDIDIPDEDTEGLKTVGDIMRYIDEHLNGSADAED